MTAKMVKCKKQKGVPQDSYQFVECGLDYVYLLNGYDLEVDEDGERYLTVHNSDNLHKEIAKQIVLYASQLEAQEVRFLRSVLGITQRQLSEFLNVDARTVQRWENPRAENIGGSSDGLLRILVWNKYLGEKDVTEFLDRCKSERYHHKMLKLMEGSDNEWKIAA